MKQATSQIHSRPFEKRVERRSNPSITANAVAQMAMMRPCERPQIRVDPATLAGADEDRLGGDAVGEVQRQRGANEEARPEYDAHSRGRVTSALLTIRLESFAAVFVRPLQSTTALETCGATRSGGSRVRWRYYSNHQRESRHQPKWNRANLTSDWLNHNTSRPSLRSREWPGCCSRAIPPTSEFPMNWYRPAELGRNLHGGSEGRTAMGGPWSST